MITVFIINIGQYDKRSIPQKKTTTHFISFRLDLQICVDKEKKELKIASCKPAAISVNVSCETYLYRACVRFISRDTDLSWDGRDWSCSKQQGIEISH
jgi:hypothetical protein